VSARRDKSDKPPAPPEPVVPSSAVAVAKIGGTVALVAAAAMSAQTLYRLGRILGYAWWNAPLLPTSLDVYAATAIWVGHRVPAEHKAHKTATRNARIALVLTICSNGLFHLLNLPGVHLPHWVGITLLVLVSALPPFVVERILHLQSAVSAGRAETRVANDEIATPESNSANPIDKTERPTTPIANPVESPTRTANDNPTPTDNRQPAKTPAAKAVANAKTAGDDNANAEEIHVAAMLPIYRQILAQTGKRPTAPKLVEMVPGLGSPSRAKQIREIVETRWHPEMKPRFPLAEAG
jgi:hypothetical protein